MVAISLYRGNLHRVSDAPREWQMPPRSITLEQFRILTEKRAQALARLAAQNNPKSDQSNEAKKAVEDEGKRIQEGKEETLKRSSVSGDSQPIQGEEVKKEVEDCKMIDAMEEVDASAKTSKADEKMEVSNNLDAAKEKRRKELEEKLQVLNQKKHNLVQMLKMILNAEEEIKRRNAQAAALRASVPLQAETADDMGSSTRLVPKLSVEVNFSGDLGAESDAAANQSAQGRQTHPMHSTSPAALSASRPFQQNGLLPTPRSSLGNSGHSQSPSNAFVGSAAITASPSRFAPAGVQPHHHHSSSLPPFSAPGSHFMASSPSPAASGGASSVFRDSYL